MYIDRSLKIMCSSGFHCIDIQINISDTGFNDGIDVSELREVESRLRVMVPKTNGLAMVVGKGDLKIMLGKLAGRIRRGTIYKLPIFKYIHPHDAWRTMELDRLYLFLDDNIKRESFPILNQRLLLYGDGKVAKGEENNGDGNEDRSRDRDEVEEKDEAEDQM